MVILKPLNHTHLPCFFRWINDEEAIEHGIFAFRNLSSKTEIAAWFEQTLQDPDCLNLAIMDETDGSCLGYTGISEIDHDFKTGEYFIFIGDKESWNKGIGTEVTKMVIDQGFTELGLETIMLTVSAHNPAGLTAYERAGFTEDGRHRQAGAKLGQYKDQVMMSIQKPGSADG